MSHVHRTGKMSSLVYGFFKRRGEGLISNQFQGRWREDSGREITRNERKDGAFGWRVGDVEGFLGMGGEVHLVLIFGSNVRRV